MENTIDRYGECPNCQVSWDGGNILQEMIKLDILIGETYENILSMANKNYGYTVENQKRFSNLISRELKDETKTIVYQCPECRQVFNEQLEPIEIPAIS